MKQFWAILPHLVPSMGDPMTPLDFFSVMHQCTKLLTTNFYPYHDYICSLDCHKSDFCHENGNFDHFNPIGGLHAQPHDPSQPCSGHGWLRQVTWVQFQPNTRWLSSNISPQKWVFFMKKAILAILPLLVTSMCDPMTPFNFFCYGQYWQVFLCRIPLRYWKSFHFFSFFFLYEYEVSWISRFWPFTLIYSPPMGAPTQCMPILVADTLVGAKYLKNCIPNWHFHWFLKKNM